MTRRLHDHQHQCTRTHCHTPTQNYLCENCTTQLANMLDQLPWLLNELDARIQQLAKVSVGTIGRQRRPAELNVMDFDAAETARTVRKKLATWVETITRLHTGRTPPALNTVSTQALARWLEHNVQAISLLQCAGDLYHDIERLVGPDTDRRGQLVAAINPHERRFAGPCPTVRGHAPDGETLECGTSLYADVDETTITCPTCQQKIDVERNRVKAAADRDLLTKDALLEALTNADEPVPAQQLDRWITSRRLRPRGWIHGGELVDASVNEHSQPAYSFKRARKLRRRDQQLTQLRHTLAEQR